MDDTSRGQVTRSAAEVYEEFFVPALFQKWAPRMAEAARLAPGQKVLDVACGTGVLAREAATRVAPGGSVALTRPNGCVQGSQEPLHRPATYSFVTSKLHNHALSPGSSPGDSLHRGDPCLQAPMVLSRWTQCFTYSTLPEN